MKNIIDTLRETPFSLVLSGGGALGIAHLGVIDDMERFGLVPAEIVGTSMGGIIGACMAVGMEAELIASLLKRFGGLSNWLDLSLWGNSIIDDDKITAIFEEIFGERLLSQTEIPLKLIATDLLTGDKRVFGPHENIRLVDTLLATMAIPGIFREQHIGGQILGDGFLCENLGIPEAEMQAILAVDVLGKNAFEHRLPDSFFKTQNVMEMFERSLRLLEYNQSRCAVAQCDKTLYLLEPDTSAFKTFHFNKVDEIKELGRGLIEHVR